MSAAGDPLDQGYWDVSGRWREVPPSTLASIRTALDEGSRRSARPLWFVRAGRAEYLQGPCDLVFEDGTTLAGIDALRPDLPPGYYDLRPLDGGPTTRLVVSPGRCHLPPSSRAWGWAVQLHATRSTTSWGIGDLGDLRRLGAWAAHRGAGMLALNPLHASGPALPQQPSPYYPSSRRWRSPLLVRVEEVPGAAALGVDLEPLARAGRALNDRRRIDRDEVWRLKRAALQLLHDASSVDDVAAFEAYRVEQGDALDQWSTYCAIADDHGNAWPAWPAELHRPDGPGVARFAEAHAARARFHAWLQWVVDVQLAGSSGLDLVQDLAVGVDPGGADAWAWQDVLALDVRVGAPPDEFNTAGQDWGLPPFVPSALRAASYEPFVQTVRAALRHAGGLRVDHVMGLFRLFWVPDGAGPGEGAYVRYPASELLDLLALESHRAGAFVVGEDLGTVEEEVRAELAERRVLSYRLLWFEPGPPAHYPEQALAAVTTHDLPTVAGLWTGSDVDAQRQAGTRPNVTGATELRDRLRALTGVEDDASVVEVTVAAYEALAQAPSHLVVATLEDALGVEERPNMPGTVDSWPNWSLALPVTLEELETDPTVEAVGQALATGRSRAQRE